MENVNFISFGVNLNVCFYDIPKEKYFTFIIYVVNNHGSERPVFLFSKRFEL